MKFGVPWGVKEIRPEARKTAKEAARRSGMSLGDWLNSVILQQAAHQDLPAHAHGDDDVHGEDLASVHQRLDDLTRRIEQLTRSGPEAYAPRRTRSDPDPSTGASRTLAPPLAPAIPPPLPSVQLPPSLDRAVAEISARRHALNGEPAPARPQPQAPMAAPEPMVASALMAAMAAMAAPAPPPMRAPLPAQDLSGLEGHLRRITDQIETLRKPGVEEAINALRDELGEIGRALNEAMPRHAIETIEKQISELGQRIAEGRQAGIDHSALAGVERGLAEVRDALRGLMPAENLAGFNEAVAGLAHKIDLIVAQNDPATLAQLESTITTLREMVAHIASNETVSQLAAEVQALGEKVEQVARAAGGSDALNNLDHRITALADALLERAQNGGAVPPRLEALVQSLCDKIDQIQLSRGDNVAISHLEDRIVSLVEKLDASESRLSQLEAIERGLSDLLVHIEDLRSNRPAEALRADNAPAVDELKHDMARTQDALEAVHGTLGLVVDRLAMIEKEFRGEGRAQPSAEAAPAPPVGTLEVRAVSEAPAEPPQMPPVTPLQMLAPPQAAPEPPPPAPPPPPQAAPRRRTATSLPLNPDPSADQPLEPGSGPPKFSARIAASEAALGGAGPAAAAAPGGKSSFIAAARRAAQAAMKQGPSASAPRAEPLLELKEGGQTSLRTRIMKRVKSLFIAASIIAVVVGGFQIAGNVLHFGHAPKSEATKTGKAEDAKIDTAVPSAAPKEASSLAANPPEQSPVPPLAAPIGTGMMSPTLPPSLNATMQGAPPLLNPSALIAPPLLDPPALGAPPPASPAPDAPQPATKGDVTGSIPEAAANQHADPSGEPGREHLPLAIGAARLRNAAMAGDAGAAYEVAVRFAEGRGVPVNLTEAAHWFAQAASRGLAPAQFRYASMLEKGQGVKKDPGQARQLYLAAAAKGHAKAMHNLAVLYSEGLDGKPDYSAAVKWFHQAALRGIADSQYNLGVLTARGLGTEKSFAESYKWFALAAAQGDQDSAKKRDEVAARLDATALAAAQQAVKTFTVEPQPKTATAVPKPQGGWDNAAGASPSPPAPPKAKAQQQQHQPSNAPLSLGSFTIGKR
jgi:localization factor PodJL